MQDIYRNIRSTPLYNLVRISDDYYAVNAKLRKYHNGNHAVNVVRGVNILTDFNPSMSLIVAAQWHDAVYFPQAGSDANERCSAQALAIESRSLNLSPQHKATISAACDLIKQTHVNVHLGPLKEQCPICKCEVNAFTITVKCEYDDHDEDVPITYKRCNDCDLDLSIMCTQYDDELSILLDADLASLSVDWDDFVRNQDSIILENNGSIPDDRYENAKFLAKLLSCREFIYRTSKGRALWEEKARANISKYCADYWVK